MKDLILLALSAVFLLIPIWALLFIVWIEKRLKKGKKETSSTNYQQGKPDYTASPEEIEQHHRYLEPNEIIF